MQALDRIRHLAGLVHQVGQRVALAAQLAREQTACPESTPQARTPARAGQRSRARASPSNRALSGAARPPLPGDRGVEKVDRRRPKCISQTHQALDCKVLQPQLDLLKVLPGQPQFLCQGLLGQTLLRTKLGYSPANIGDHVFCIERAGTQGASVSLSRLDKTPAYGLVFQ